MNHVLKSTSSERTGRPSACGENWEWRPHRFSNLVNLTSSTYSLEFTLRPVVIGSRFSCWWETTRTLRGVFSPPTSLRVVALAVVGCVSTCEALLVTSQYRKASHDFFAFPTWKVHINNTSSACMMFIHRKTLNRVFTPHPSSCSK